MATLTAVKFNTADGAEKGIAKLQELQEQKLISVLDAALVTWPEGKKKPKTRHLTNTVGMGILDGTFWGMLFGMIFFMPFLGAAIGAMAGALSGAMVNVGIDDAFIDRVRKSVSPGTSALFVLSTDAVIDRCADAFKDLKPEIIATNLPKDQEAKLREYFAHA